MADILILLLAAVCQALLAWIGVHVSANPPQDQETIRRIKMSFFIIAAIGIAAIGTEGYRSNNVLEATKDGVENIEAALHIGGAGHPKQPPVLAIDCHPSVLPNFAPAEGVNTLNLFHSEGGAEAIGLGGSITQPGQLLGWYQDRTIFPILRCDLSNKEPMYSVVMNLHAKFSKFTSNPTGVGSIGDVVYERDWPIGIPQIDSNKPFSFYAYTSSIQYAVNAQFLDATFLSVDTNERVKARVLTLGFPLTFFPAKMNATNN